MAAEDALTALRCVPLCFAEHCKTGTVSVELRVHHDTVALAIEAHRPVNDAFRASSSVLHPYRESYD